MARALLIVDVQKDFLDDGPLPTAGGREIAAAISEYLHTRANRYAIIVASRDSHEAAADGDARFACRAGGDDAASPAHCVAHTPGATFADELNTNVIDVKLVKRDEGPERSAFDGALTIDGEPLTLVLQEHAIDSLDVVGLPGNHSVRATAIAAREHVDRVRVFRDLIALDDSEETDLAEALTSADVELRDAPTSKVSGTVWPSFSDSTPVDPVLLT